MSWRYWRWQVLRNLPLALTVAALVLALGLLGMRMVPTTHVALSRVVLETPLAQQDTPRAARTTQNVQHLQVVIHILGSLETRIQIANTLRIPLEQVNRTTLSAKIQSGRDKPTNLIVEAKAATEEIARSLAAVATEAAITISDRLQRERVEASLTNLRALAVQHTGALSSAQEDVDAFDTAEVSAALARAERLDAQAARVAAQQDGTPALIQPTNPVLNALQRELSQARGIYSDRHPKVRLLLSRIEQLTPTASTAFEKPVSDQTEQDIVALRNEAEKLRDLGRRFGEASAALKAAQDRLDTTNTALNDAQVRAERSVVRLKLVEDATLTSGSREKKMMALLAAIATAALGLGLGAVALRIKLDARLRRPADLTRSLGLTAFATIPNLGPRLS